MSSNSLEANGLTLQSKKPARTFSFALGIRRSESGTPKPAQNRSAGDEPPAPLLNEPIGLHVIQRAAPPAREPAPIGVDIISRAIIPAGVKQMPAATARFTLIAFFRPTAALFIRLLTGFFVSHSLSSLLLGFYLPATSFRVTAGRQLCRFPARKASLGQSEIRWWKADVPAAAIFEIVRGCG